MVSNQVITPAVWTETARNLATHGTFEIPGSLVEVVRSYFNPALLNTLGMGATVLASGTTRGFSLPVTPGDVYSIRRKAPLTARFRYVFTASAPAGGVAYFGGSGNNTTYDAVEAVENIVVPGGATHMFIYLSNSLETVSGLLIVRGATVGAYWDAAGPSPDADLTAGWSGPVDASDPILRGTQPSGVAPVSLSWARAFQSTQWTSDGSHSMRVAPFLPVATVANSAIGAFVDMAPLTEAGKTYTIIVKVRKTGSASVLPSLYGAVDVYDGTYQSRATTPNAAGEYEVRFTATRPGATFQLRLVHGQPAGTAPDIFFDSVTIVEGTYTGPAFSGGSYSTDRKRYRWLGLADGSISTEEIVTVAEVTAPIFEVVTLTSSTDEIVFRAEPGATGFVYDNETLQRWYNLAPIDAPVNKRPNAHGAFGLGQTFTAEHRPLISGKYFGTSSAAAKLARKRLVAMFSDGNPIAMSVTDEQNVTTRRAVWMSDYDAPFSHDFSYFTFDLEFIAPDPRRYGDGYSDSTGMPTLGSGLVWDLGTAPSTLYFDWGTPGLSGQVSFTNTGGATTYPRIDVGGPGAFAGGFVVTEIETGRELTYVAQTFTGDVVSFDSRTHVATLNGGGDVTNSMTSRDWFEIPAGATRRYQINALAGVTGAPTMTIYTAPADL